jgi:AcrR family transcriptional regulator
MPERKGGSAELGLRERGKRERLRRIKEAAHEAFRTQGYNGASTREIAKQADVSIGTLFVYAQDKRDLLFLVLNEDLDPLFRQALSGVLSDAPVLDQLVSLLRPIYE